MPTDKPDQNGTAPPPDSLTPEQIDWLKVAANPEGNDK